MQELETRFTELEKKIENLTGTITTGFEAVSENLKSLEKKIESVQSGSREGMGLVENKVSRGFEDVASRLDTIITELRKINAVTNYEEQHKNLPNNNIGKA